MRWVSRRVSPTTSRTRRSVHLTIGRFAPRGVVPLGGQWPDTFLDRPRARVLPPSRRNIVRCVRGTGLHPSVDHGWPSATDWGLRAESLGMQPSAFIDVSIGRSTLRHIPARTIKSCHTVLPMGLVGIALRWVSDELQWSRVGTGGGCVAKAEHGRTRIEEPGWTRAFGRSTAGGTRR